MKTRLRMGVYGLLIGLIALFLAPIASEAYTAKGITNSNGLVYDDVYGVSNGAAIMRKGDRVALVDSLGNVLLDTVSGVETFISDSVYFPMRGFDKGLVALSYGKNEDISNNSGYYDIKKRRTIVNSNVNDLMGQFSKDSTLFAKASIRDGKTVVSLYSLDMGTELSSSAIPFVCVDCSMQFADDNSALTIYYSLDNDDSNVSTQNHGQGQFAIRDGILGEFKPYDSSQPNYYYTSSFDRDGNAFTVCNYINGCGSCGSDHCVSIISSESTKHLPDCSLENVVGEFVIVNKYEKYGDSSEELVYSCRGDRVEWIESLLKGNTLYTRTKTLFAFDRSSRYIISDTTSSSCALYDVDGNRIKNIAIPAYTGGSEFKVWGVSVPWSVDSLSLYDAAPVALLTYKDANTDDTIGQLIDENGEQLYSVKLGRGGYLSSQYCKNFVSVSGSANDNAGSTVFINLKNKKVVGELDCSAIIRSVGGLILAGEFYYDSTPLYTLSDSGLTRFSVGSYNISACQQSVDVSKMQIGPSSPYHSTCDAWWAKDNNGKWGLIKTDGTIIVPFEYDAYEDLDFDNENLVLVKKDGLWWFFDTSEKTEQGSEGNIKFADVDSSTPHSEDIHWLANSGISEGWLEQNGSRTFRGMDSVKRQDMAAFLYRLAGSPEFVAPATSPFIDVTSSTPHYKEICWLAQTGISTGWKVSSGYEFRGMDSVKRLDMAAFLKRLSDYLNKGGVSSSSNPFADVNESTPHYEEVLWLSENGVSEGWAEADGTRTFRGMSDVVRLDMAAFLHRMDANGLV